MVPKTPRDIWLGHPGADQRSHYIGFAVRTRKNLHFIKQALHDGHDVHVVTQLVNSLLGVVVFPWERGALDRAGNALLTDLEAQGWPMWSVLPESSETATLRDLLRHFRHSVAHGNVRFTSDSRLLTETYVEVANFPKAKPGEPPRRKPAWAARIRADDLLQFLLLLIYFIEENTNPYAA